MKKIIIFTPLIFCLLIWAAPGNSQDVWTERKLGKVIIRAEKAALKKRWKQAIKYGTRALDGSMVLDQKEAPRYINLLKNLNIYYDKSGKLKNIPEQVETAYNLSAKVLGDDHPTTLKSRSLYFKILLSQKRFSAAIPLVLEDIAVYENDEKEQYKILVYLSQLYSLYALTGQFEREGKALERLLALNIALFGEMDDSHFPIIRDLSHNYCRQKEQQKFNGLIEKYNLKYQCQF